MITSLENNSLWKSMTLFSCSAAIAIFILLFPVRIQAETVVLVTSFQNKTEERRWDWVGYALEETVRRWMGRWENVALYPLTQEMPDSAEICLEGKTLNPVWADFWRIDLLAGGSFQIKGQRLEITLRMRNLSSETKLDTIVFTGSVLSVNRSAADIAKEIARKLKYSIRIQEMEGYYAGLTRTENAYSAFAAGIGGYKKGEADVALFAFRRAAEIDPNFAEAHAFLGLILLRLGKKTESIASLYRAMELKPLDPFFRIYLATAYFDNHQDGLAERTLASLDKKFELIPEALNLRGLLFLRKGMTSQALSCFIRAMGKNPSCWDYPLHLGMTYYRLGQYVQAIEEYEKLVHMAPQKTRFLILLGMAYRKGGYLKESMEVLQRGQIAGKTSVDVLIQLSATFQELRWYQQADYMLERALELDSARSELYSCKGLIALERQDTLGAKLSFQKALALDPANVSAHNNLGVLAMMQREYANADKEFGEALKLGGANAVTLFNRALARNARSSKKEALQCLEDAMFFDPGYFPARVLAADLYIESQSYERAVAIYREYLEINPLSDSSRVRLAYLLAQMGRAEEAITEMEAAVKRNAGDIDFIVEIAHLYREINWLPVAILKYENALRIDSRKADALWGLGATCFLAGETGKKKEFAETYGRALFYLKACLDQDSLNENARYWMGRLVLETKNDAPTALKLWAPLLAPSYEGRYAQDVRKRRENLP